MEVAEGNTHEESTIDNTSGIKLYNNGEPIAEIEDEETVKDGENVYSDRLTFDGKHTYAEGAKRLGKEKGKAEAKLKEGNGLMVNTAKRSIEGIDKLEDSLFLHQEMSKVNKGIKSTKKMQEGGFTKNLVEGFVPYIDNIINAGLIKRTPKVEKPSLQRVRNLKTKINVNPQVANVQDQIEAASNFIGSNTSNSANARNEIAKVRLTGSKNINEILTNKENIETNLKNQNIVNKQRIEAGNLHRINRYKDMNTARTSNILGKISANTANLVGDAISQIEYRDKQEFQDEQLDVAREMYTKGSTARAQLNNPTEVEALMGNTDALQKLWQKVEGTPDETQFKLKFPTFTPINKNGGKLKYAKPL